MGQTKTTWVRERWRDMVMWPKNMARDWARRLQRLAQARSGLYNAVTLLPEERPGSGRAVRLHALAASVFDLLGGPEIAQYVMHFFMVTTPLTTAEREAIASALGPDAIRYDDVRVAEGGILPFVFGRNGGRAFCTWHTIHLPRQGKSTRKDLSLLVHEATHVMQYERMGTLYIGEALFAQRRLGHGAYDYGGVQGLQRAHEAGVPLSAFNREAQAQIVQDWYRRREQGLDVQAHEPYVAAARAGAFMVVA